MLTRFSGAVRVASGPGGLDVMKRRMEAHSHLMLDRALYVYDEALRCWRAAVKLDPRYALAWQNIVRTLDMKGDASGAAVAGEASRALATASSIAASPWRWRWKGRV